MTNASSRTTRTHRTDDERRRPPRVRRAPGAIACALAVIFAASAARAEAPSDAAAAVVDEAAPSLRLVKLPVLDLEAPSTAFPEIQLRPVAASGDDVRRPDASVRRRASAGQYAWAIEDGRAFWYSAGAAAVTSLGGAVLLGLPYLILTGIVFNAALLVGPIPLAVTVLGLAGGFLLLDSAIAALAGHLVFNSMSRVYEASYWAGLAGHFAGNVAAVSGGALVFGFGTMLWTGLSGLAGFTGAAGSQAVLLFSFLGIMPAVVIGAVGLVAIPALFSAWAMSVTAKAREGFAVDPAYAQPVALSPVEQALPPDRRPPVAALAIALPGT